MLIGYASKKLQKICTRTKDAKKALSAHSADRLFDRLSDLAAFNNLGEIRFRAPPLDFHPLTENRSGEFAIKIHELDRICFRPTGNFARDAVGESVLATVTEVEITFVGDYHNYG
ncbi:MAG: hypothetical protein JNM43_13725 [Planctomycetaceae bacterium]|nr:hypothetical protein [Planctomycetaceae bacterium]